MNHAYQYFVFQFRGAVPLVCLLVLAFNAALFLPIDILEADLEGSGVENQLQLVGLLLLFVLIPMWLLSCFIFTQRHSLALANQLDATLPPELRLGPALVRFPRRHVLTGLAASVFYALVFNVPTQQYGAVLAGDLAVIGLFIGQLLVWVCVGLMLAMRLYAVNLFNRAGGVIPVSIFEQQGLAPFARVGMLDVVIVVGGMAIATVQSIDAQFRAANYLTAMLVAVPAATALLLRPMWSLHQRLAARKSELLNEVNTQIAQAPESGDIAAIDRLESLLQRRDRVKSLHTWPLDVRIWSRLVFYVLIPPLAWAGAALVEVAVSRWLGV